MPAETPHVGVRTFDDSRDVEPFLIADMSTIGLVTVQPDASNTLFPLNEPVSFNTDDRTYLAGLGANPVAGGLLDTVAAITSEGVIARICTVRVAEGANYEATLANLIGSAANRTGAYAFLEAESETGDAPDILISPGFMGQRVANAANPLATALDGISDILLTAMTVADGPGTNNVAASEWAADFSDTVNMICIDPPVQRAVNGTAVTRPASAHMAAAMVKADKMVGGPYASPLHPRVRGLKGIVAPARAISFRIHDPDCDANWLVQRGVGTIVDGSRLGRGRVAQRASGPKGKMLWAPFNTSTNNIRRDIKVVRVEKMVREVIPRTLANYIGQDLGAHLAVLILTALDEFIQELAAPNVRAVLGGRVQWLRANNQNGVLRTGGLRVNLWHEPPPTLTDLGIYVGRYEHAFDILADQITAAMRRFEVRGQLPPGVI